MSDNDRIKREIRAEFPRLGAVVEAAHAGRPLSPEDSALLTVSAAWIRGRRDISKRMLELVSLELDSLEAHLAARLEREALEREIGRGYPVPPERRGVGRQPFIERPPNCVQCGGPTDWHGSYRGKRRWRCRAAGCRKTGTLDAAKES